MTDFKPKLVWQTENYRCVQVKPFSDSNNVYEFQYEFAQLDSLGEKYWVSDDDSLHFWSLIREFSRAILEGKLK